MTISIKRAAVAAGAAALGLFAATASVSAAEHDWKMATPYGGGPWLERDVQLFVDNVEALTDGRVVITPYPGGTLYSQLKVTEGVSKGVAEAGHNWPGYDWGLDETTVLFAGHPFGMTPEELILWYYAGGGLEIWEEFRRENFGVVSLPCTIGGTSTGFHSHKRIQTLEDFQGLKLRTSGAFAEIASRLGAATMVIPGAEVYEALERNVIDAVEWGSPEINRATGFQDVAQYIITPGLDLSGGSFECMFNPDAWDALSELDRDRIRMAAKQTLFETWVLASASDLSAFQDFAEGPNEIVRVDDAVLERIKQVTHEWEDEIAAENEWFKRALDSQRAFKAKLAVWPEYRFQIGSLGQ
ncbi:MAG: C4-dicarboxylate ABC transporter substrate-binding protein [Marinibacterium sp.]|nr:C4-dicarboxylate ABC transporter substrate-binding protein [Marinibacterium sp.]